jgi:AcrR family transcriptional regulator
MNHNPTKAIILQAALQCFTQQGVAATTIEQIRATAQTSIGSIYHHFKSKEQLAVALYLAELSRYQQGIHEILQVNPPAETAIKAIVQYHLNWVAANPDSARYLFMTRQTEFLQASAEELHALNHNFFQTLRPWIQAQIASNALRNLPADVFFAVLIGPSQEFARHWLAQRAKTAITDAAPLLAAATWQALQGNNSGQN